MRMEILHHDISIGNVFLSDEDDPESGAEGFLADLDYAVTPSIFKSVTGEVIFSGKDPHPGHRNLAMTESGSRQCARFTLEPALPGDAVTVSALRPLTRHGY